MLYSKSQSGITLIEVVVVSAIVTMFFAGLLGGFYYTLNLIQDSKLRQTALTVANAHMEFIRSLSYDAVGTVSGIPNGAIPQIATTTQNDIEFTIRTLIEFVDDPADGLGVSDGNSITTDYKTAKVTVSWVARGVTREVFLVSRVIPRSIETNVGGGTLRVNVFDANVLPLPGATVRLINTTGTSSIDVTRITNADGVALFGGAPANSGYEIIVTDPGYSTDRTEQITATLVNPSTPPVTVAGADITTVNFFIDALSTTTIRTISSAVGSEFVESFVTDSGVVASSSVVIGSDRAVLATDGSGDFFGTGSVWLAPFTPVPLVRWGQVKITDTLPALTSRTFEVWTTDAVPVRVPDTIIPGNSSGLSVESLDLSRLDPVVYPGLQLRFTLETADPSQTPLLDAVSISYVESETIIPNASFALQGSKILGTDALGVPVYKYATTTTTDANGQRVLPNLEWDSYTITPSGSSITEACPAHPLIVPPGVVSTVTLTLAPFTTHALRVVVTDINNVPQNNVELQLTRAGVDETEVTGLCGQASFLSLTAENDYTLTLRVGGIVVRTETNVSVSGQTVRMVQLP